MKLVMDDLHCGYGKKEIIKTGVITVEPGRVLTLIGENGSGKSTLLKTLACLMKPLSGNFIIDGRDPGKLSRKERADLISYLPQNTGLPDMRVQVLTGHGRYSKKNIGERSSEADRNAVEQALAITGMTDFADRNIRELSGGERKKAFLAMMIAQDADIVLLDEPFADIDIGHKSKLHELLRELTKKGKIVIMSSHDLPESFSISDDIALIHDGRIIAYGNPEKISKDREILRTAMGVALKRSEDKNTLYEYELVR